MMQVLLVAAGGAIGAVARYGVGVGAAGLFGLAFPWGTLIVNVVGCLAMGVLAARVGPEQESLRLALGVGVLGGFTTFSAFSLETVRLMQHQPGLSAIYVLASVLLSVGACWAGLSLGRV
ncbi:MAG TPA: fluoride efflux transporter CrcB [Vitreimonas sp.]|uniref:fluoride efflux transporter CrcB n=1 Tax=Vitreimonas sp. TaxID=3069702 RepID=UPI002D5669E4|nr:fluoride efflux transporter CrcB [Vitreimonas sp.]HYD88350.1 fluoride efflux transporter CrcB [Vitreimonas sp.]